LTVGFIVGFGLLAALIVFFPLVTEGALVALTPAEAGFDTLAIPRAAGGLAAADAGMGFFMGAGLPPVTGFLV
jgi:membrane associated rhomboid family serine protease